MRRVFRTCWHVVTFDDSVCCPRTVRSLLQDRSMLIFHGKHPNCHWSSLSRDEAVAVHECLVVRDVLNVDRMRNRLRPFFLVPDVLVGPALNKDRPHGGSRDSGIPSTAQSLGCTLQK